MLKEDVRYKYIIDSPPLQPFTKKYESYQECQISWNSYCLKKDALFYQFKTGREAETIELFPDACLNVLFELEKSKPRALFSGTFLRAETLDLKPETVYFGFKPYSNSGFRSQKIHLREMVNSFTDFAYVFPDSDCLIANLNRADGLRERAYIFSNYAAEHLVDDAYYPTLVDYLAAMLCSAQRTIDFNNISEVFGYSERYCREKFKECYGISPKQYSDIIRFQNTMKILLSGSWETLCSLAAINGYFDQSHLIHDFRRYTNVPPEKFLKKYSTYQPDRRSCRCI